MEYGRELKLATFNNLEDAQDYANMLEGKGYSDVNIHTKDEGVYAVVGSRTSH